MIFRLLAILGIGLTASSLAGEKAGIERPSEGATIDQMLHSKKACGPAAMLNAVKFGAPAAYQQLLGADEETRLRFVIDRYFRKPSTTSPNAMRFTDLGGTGHADLAAAMRDLAEEHGLPEIISGELLRAVDENSRDFLFRIHRQLLFSLDRGVLPIIALRSQFTQQDEETGEWGWRAMADHYVVVFSVPNRLAEGELGFAFEYIDPDGGRMATGFIYAERMHAFAGFQGDSERGRWAGGNRFLLVTAPRSYSLIDEDQVDWNERVLTTLSYFVGS